MTSVCSKRNIPNIVYIVLECIDLLQYELLNGLTQDPDEGSTVHQYSVKNNPTSVGLHIHHLLCFITQVVKALPKSLSGKIAQLARASGSYPEGYRFNSYSCYHYISRGGAAGSSLGS